MNAEETVQSLCAKGYTALQVVHSAKAHRSWARKRGGAAQVSKWGKAVRLAEQRLELAYAEGLVCNSECMTAQVPKEKCRCSCRGVNHGTLAEKG